MSGGTKKRRRVWQEEVMPMSTRDAVDGNHKLPVRLSKAPAPSHAEDHELHQLAAAVEARERE